MSADQILEQVREPHFAIPADIKASIRKARRSLLRNWFNPNQHEDVLVDLMYAARDHKELRQKARTYADGKRLAEAYAAHAKHLAPIVADLKAIDSLLAVGAEFDLNVAQAKAKRPAHRPEGGGQSIPPSTTKALEGIWRRYVGDPKADINNFVWFAREVLAAIGEDFYTFEEGGHLKDTIWKHLGREPAKRGKAAKT